MGKVYGLCPLELRPGIEPAEFEQFARQSLRQWPSLPGWRFALLKGDHGDHEGSYQLLVEIDSPEARDRVQPVDGPVEEGQCWFAMATPFLEQWRHYTTTAPGLDGGYTDYHDIST